jgi:hypothetical protein
MLALARNLHDGNNGINEKVRGFDYDISRKSTILPRHPMEWVTNTGRDPVCTSMPLKNSMVSSTSGIDRRWRIA